MIHLLEQLVFSLFLSKAISKAISLGEKGTQSTTGRPRHVLRRGHSATSCKIDALNIDIAITVLTIHPLVRRYDEGVTRGGRGRGEGVA